MSGDHGTLVAWSQVDGVGRIRLDGGDELRVGQSAFRYQQPAVGHRCDVVEAEPHPMGGRRATRVELLDEPKQAVEKKAAAAPNKELAAWLLERIRSSSRQPVANVEVENLISCYQAFSTHDKKQQVFGIDPRQVEASKHPELVKAIKTELEGWRDRLTSPLDQFHLDRAGRRVGLGFLHMQLPKLRCEPLGTTDGLHDAWLRRISFLREAMRGKRQLQLSCLGLDEEKRLIEWGKPDREAIYEVALTYEVGQDAVFPRELAAMAAVADGLSVGGAPVLRPILQWSVEDDGLAIGSGSTYQGSLVLVGDGPLLGRELVDRDDDGTKLHGFAGLGGFLDALLGV